MKYIHAIIVLLLTFNFTAAQVSKFNHSLFDELLKENVDEEGMVNYEAFIGNNKFDKYISALEKADINDLPGTEKYAFLINAYNALVIKNVVDHWSVNSPMDVEGFFDKIKFTLARREVSLDQLEYDYIFKIDPVLCHFGLVCAGKSCPKLLPKAYGGGDIYKQLEFNAREFLNNPAKNKLDRKNNILYLSEAFKWFADIFTDKYGSVVEAALNFMNKEDSKYIKENEISVKYMRYDWSLNNQ